MWNGLNRQGAKAQRFWRDEPASPFGSATDSRTRLSSGRLLHRLRPGDLRVFAGGFDELFQRGQVGVLELVEVETGLADLVFA